MWLLDPARAAGTVPRACGREGRVSSAPRAFVAAGLWDAGRGIAAFAFPPALPPETASVQSAEGLLPVQCPVIPGAGKPWDLHLVVQQLSPFTS